MEQILSKCSKCGATHNRIRKAGSGNTVRSSYCGKCAVEAAVASRKIREYLKRRSVSATEAK